MAARCRPLLVLLLLAALFGGTIATPAQARTEAAAGTATDDVATYVDAVFQQFLERPATDTDIERWRPAVQWGDASALSGTLAVSDEWAGTQVDGLYQQILGRSPDAAGHDHWVSLIAHGTTLEEVAAFLYGSDEYYERSGATPGAFVESVYQQLLGREPDAGGRQYWIDRIDRGTSRTTVATGFYGAIESRRDRVTGLYQDLLGRAPDVPGRDYWVDQLPTTGDVALAAYLAASDEFYVRATGHQPVHEPRAVATDFAPYATVGPVTLLHPAAAVERIGFHESGHDGSQQATPTAEAVRPVTLETRNRGTGSRTAADIVVAPGTEIRAPVSGRVVRAGTYTLYCRYRDDYLVIEPDSRPGWEVKMFHIDGVLVGAGQRVEAGVTRVAPGPTILPFASQVDERTAEPSWPHVHVEVVDPSIPDRPSGSC